MTRTVGAIVRRIALFGFGGVACLLVACVAGVYALPSIQFPSGPRKRPGLGAAVFHRAGSSRRPAYRGANPRGRLCGPRLHDGAGSSFSDRHDAPQNRWPARGDHWRIGDRRRSLEPHLRLFAPRGRYSRAIAGDAKIRADRLRERRQSGAGRYGGGADRILGSRLQPERWSPRDSILVALNLSTLSYAVEEERMASVMRAALPAAVVSFLTPDSDCYNEKLAPGGANFCADASRPPEELRALLRRSTGRRRIPG